MQGEHLVYRFTRSAALDWSSLLMWLSG
jgi:hypothetical protein